MEILDIKSNLTLSQVLKHYHLKPDKQLRLNCPFHDDKTPSMQVYYKTHTAYCFSGNCKTHGRSLDVIDFIMYMEECSKHEAIVRAKEMIQLATHPGMMKDTVKLPLQTSAVERVDLLSRMFTYFKNAVHNSKQAQEYLQSRCLDHQKLEVGYNSGQFHHGTRKDEALIQRCIQYGLLLDLGNKSRTGHAAYKPFGKWCIVFPLKDEHGQIVSMYFRSTLDQKTQRHFYLRDRQGLYPAYPRAETQKLILTESIIDAASLLQQEEITTQYDILSLYGTNGLTEEHLAAIRKLKHLNEIIFFLNGDEAGLKATEKYAGLLRKEIPHVSISQVEVLQDEDINSVLQGHSPSILSHLIETRKEVAFVFSNETSNEEEKQQYPVPELFVPTKEEQSQAVKRLVHESQENQLQPTGLDTTNPYNLKYRSERALYQVKGFRTEQMDSLKITLQVSLIAPSPNTGTTDN